MYADILEIILRPFADYITVTIIEPTQTLLGLLIGRHKNSNFHAKSKTLLPYIKTHANDNDTADIAAVVNSNSR